MSWGMPASLLTKAIVSGLPAVAEIVFVSNSMPWAVTVTSAGGRLAGARAARRGRAAGARRPAWRAGSARRWRGSAGRTVRRPRWDEPAVEDEREHEQRPEQGERAGRGARRRQAVEVAAAVRPHGQGVLGPGIAQPADEADHQHDQARREQPAAEDEAEQHDRDCDRRDDRPERRSRHVDAGRRLGRTTDGQRLAPWATWS